MFLVAYSAKSKSITQEMMHDCGLCPMECHSLEYDGFKYSYVKLYRRVREGQIRAFMLHAINNFGVEQDDEDDTTGSGKRSLIVGEKKSNTLIVHPVIRLIKANLSNPDSTIEIESWKDEEGTGSAKRVLGKRFKTTEMGEGADEGGSEASEELAAVKTKLQRTKTDVRNLAGENDDLIEKNMEFQKEIKKLEAENDFLTKECKELKEKLRDCSSPASEPV